ncbi:MAG: fumarate reductase [Elusimicrobia bacterium RBG_16_66_12]|nr:MAG: fumarate reductase [Elusimicrobia bacterium RBG_16_66_12]
MNLTLKVWRQKDAQSDGGFVEYKIADVTNDMSFLEMLDILNEELVAKGSDAISFDHDCREGICGMCALMIDGQAHGKDKAATSCQLHMRRYQDGDTITIEPFRAKAFPVLKDLVVDRSAFDRIQAAGGFVSVATGNAQDANAILIPKQNAEKAMDAASCIGCGACVAACPNASAMLFVAAKVSQYALLPQGRPEREKRVLAMREAMDAEGFGHCTNEYECEASCPKGINVSNIARLNREFLRAAVLAE